MSIVDQVRNTVDIVEVVREYIPGIKKVGRDYCCLCPFHQERNPSFYVSARKNMFYCFGCQVGGDVFTFVSKMDHISRWEAIKKLAQRVGIQVDKIDDKDYAERKAVLDVLDFAAKYYHQYLLKEAPKAKEYLLSRGISQKSIDTFLLGYAPEGNKFVEICSKKYALELILKTGLVALSEKTSKPFDYLRNRIVFPIFSPQGKIVSFGGRILQQVQVQNDLPVYLNTPETVVFAKRWQLYGLYHSEQALRHTNKAILVEGYIDVIMSHQYGIENAIAPLGTTLTNEQAQLLKRYVREVVILYDADEGGFRAALRAAHIFLQIDLPCRIALLPTGVDPDKYLLQHGKDSFLQVIDRSINPCEFHINQCSSKYGLEKPEAKVHIVNEVSETIRHTTNLVLRQEMIKILSNKLNIPESVIQGELQRLSKTESSILGRTTFHKIDNTFLEREIINLCIRYPELIADVPENIFSDFKYGHILDLLHKGISFGQLLDTLDEDTINWLTQLLFEEEEEILFPRERLISLLKHIQRQHQEQRRKELEPEVVAMLSGSREIDTNKLEEYNTLTRQLKGSKN